MNTWTREEDEIIINNYPKYGIWVCVELLENRSKRSIQQRRKKLNLETRYPVKSKWTEENLSDIVKSSFTYIECLKKLGINNYGSSTNTLKKYIIEYNLDVSHFRSGTENAIIKNTIPLNEILVENSSYTNRTKLKKRLYDSGLKKPICELCNQDENWNGMTISLILDHVNGINNDNRLENLRIVCPNCNAGLPTHCRNNYKNNNYGKTRIN